MRIFPLGTRVSKDADWVNEEETPVSERSDLLLQEGRNHTLNITDPEAGPAQPEINLRSA